MKFLAIIPSRFASTRLPGKPLVDIGGKTMIERVYAQASTVFDNVVVATDDIRIADEVESFGGEFVMTSVSHQSGTDRCVEALNVFEQKTKQKFNVVINIQGDEPFIKTEQLHEIKACFNEPRIEIATLIKKITSSSELFNPNKPKVTIRINGDSIYFSRSPIPYARGIEDDNWQSVHTYFKHIGMYGYRAEILRVIADLKQSSLEIAEQLEQNRWLENGYKIQTAITTFESDAVDTPEDLAYVIKKYL